MIRVSASTYYRWTAIARSMENPRFLSRMFTEGEQVKIMEAVLPRQRAYLLPKKR